MKTTPRKIRFARSDGMSLILLGGLSLLFSVFSISLAGIVVSAIVCVCGVIERAGADSFERGEFSLARRQLVGSQIAVLCAISAYALLAVFTFRLEDAVSAEGITMLGSLGASRAEVEALARKTAVLTYVTVVAVSVLYQGGLATYYHVKVARERDGA